MESVQQTESTQKQPKEIQLKEPQFIKIRQIKFSKTRFCQNIYAKVIAVTHSEKQLNNKKVVKIAEGCVADDSYYIPFRIVGESAKLLQQGAVVAFRNLQAEIFKGVKRISVDIYGKITAEPDVKVESVVKLSKLNELKPGENGLHIALKVINISSQEKEEDKKNPGKQIIKSVEGVCGDETAIINFRVFGRNSQQIKEGKTYLFFNSLSEVPDEIHQIASGHKGGVYEYQGDIQTTTTNKNLSGIKYEKVVFNSNDEEKQQSGNERKNNNRNQVDGKNQQRNNGYNNNNRDGFQNRGGSRNYNNNRDRNYQNRNRNNNYDNRDSSYQNRNRNNDYDNNDKDRSYQNRNRNNDYDYDNNDKDRSYQNRNRNRNNDNDNSDRDRNYQNRNKNNQRGEKQYRNDKNNQQQ